jgi:transcriptional regulator with PAS, ATPase and Fis domain
MQVKLLRILQEGTYTPVGSTEVKQSSARVVCATNKDLERMVKEGLLREDLYYRLNVLHLHVPPLRGRKEDIPMLVDSFFEKYAKLANRSPKTLTASCMSKLMEYDWPGNVRELENEIERLCVLSGDQAWIDEVNLSQRIIDVLAQQSAPYRLSGKLKDALEHLEKEMILTGLKRTKWNKSRLAKELGISRAGLIMKVEKYGLEKRDISESA